MLRKPFWMRVATAGPLLTMMILGTTTAWASAHADTATHAAQAARGQYVVKIAGCNDCHTPGYAQGGGKVPTRQLLIGSGMVFVGPWGTSYPTNLRLLMQDLTLEQWLQQARTTKALPPMPWYSLRSMSDNDLAAIYTYIRSLGPAGKPAPDALPPGELPSPPYMQVVLPAKPAPAK